MACTIFISPETQNPKLTSMKNLYAKNKIHPSPSPPPISAHLALLPATILTLTTALSHQDREVLAYLISCSTSSSTSDFSDLPHHRKPTKPGNDHRSNNITSRGLDHEKTFGCDCFKCYMSFWVLWDTSPNRELIHEIIEAYEDDLYYKIKKNVKVKVKKQKKSSRVYDYMAEEPEKVEVCQPDINNDVTGDDEMKMEMDKASSSFMKQVFRLIEEKIWGAVLGASNNDSATVIGS